MVKATKWFIFIVLAVGMSFDVYLAYNSVRGDTISEVTLARSIEWLMWPWGFGVVAGHLFWPARKVPYKWERIWVLALLSVALLAVDFFAASFQPMPLWPLVVGIFCGHLLWPQRVPA